MRSEKVNDLMVNVMPVKLFDMRSSLCLLFAGLMLIMSSSSSASQLTVRVFERGGKAPLEGVAVCLGTSARLTQFGASLTNAEGYVVFQDVPQTPLLVTASRPGYMSGQERMVSSGGNRMLVLSLPTGGGGVQCPMDQGAGIQRTGNLEIESFLLNDGAAVTANRLVTLGNKITGHATQYRVSERSDFQGAEWLAYEKVPRFRLSAGQGNKTVYFQVRRHVVINGAGIEARSSVLHDSINLRF